MKMPIRLIAPAVPVVPLSEYAAYLRQACQFDAATDAEIEAEIQPSLMAATRAIETQLSIALIEQRWLWQLAVWPQRAMGKIALPIKPVRAIDSIVMFDAVGNVDVWDSTKWHFDPVCQALIALENYWPAIPLLGRAEIVFDVGYGSTSADIPEDLRWAVMMLGAHYYENREAIGEAQAPLPMGVRSLLVPYTELRL